VEVIKMDGTRRGPNIDEITNLGVEYVPSTMRFQASDAQRFWMIDTGHCPAPFYPLELTTVVQACAYGIDRACEMISTPSHGETFRIVNGRKYFSPLDISDVEEIQKRLARMSQQLQKYFSDWESLWEERERHIKEGLDWMQSFDYEVEPDLNDPRWIYNLCEYFERMVSILFRAEEAHFEFLVPTQIQTLNYRGTLKELVPGTSDADCDEMLQGFGNKLMETDVAFWRCGELARDMGLANTIKNSALEEVIASLQKTENGKRWVEELKNTVNVYGLRHTGGCLNIASVSFVEDLTYPVSFILGLMERQERGEKLVPMEELTAKRKEAVSRFRGRIESEEQKEKFDEMLSVMQKLYPWIEDHNFLIEGKLNTLIHLKMVELGRRLVNEDYIDEAYDVFYLTGNELRLLLHDLMMKHLEYRDNHMEVKSIVNERRWTREKQLQWEFPVVLGVMPLQATRDPISMLIYGANEENIERASKKWERPEKIMEFDGLPAAPGVVEGVVRVVHEVGQLKEIRLGEILVCPATNPMWNPVFGKIKGIVCDVGGTLCHAGIIAREYGIPAVVGTGYATKILQTGDRIRMDGTLGLIIRKEESKA
jgi:pyruvate,water dikinase